MCPHLPLLKLNPLIRLTPGTCFLWSSRERHPRAADFPVLCLCHYLHLVAAAAGGKVTLLRLVLLSFGTPLQRNDTATHFVGVIHASAVFLPVPSIGPTSARLVVAVLTSSAIPTPSQSRSVNTGVSRHRPMHQ